MRSRLRNLAIGLALGLAGVLVGAQSITIPNTFVNGTTADATQVNANFTALSANALNRAAGIFSGTATPASTTPSTSAPGRSGSRTSTRPCSAGAGRT
jgi:hypothetical protein